MLADLPSNHTELGSIRTGSSGGILDPGAHRRSGIEHPLSVLSVSIDRGRPNAVRTPGFGVGYRRCGAP
jgi:hypothetical protein